ncbi:hypothetical protein SprV_0100109100 [Sparganum proliferum]
MPLVSTATESPPSPTYAVSWDSPSEGEVADAIRKLRNNKAPGEDGIRAEIYKSCVDTLAPWIHEMIEQAWRNEIVPDDWGSITLVPILRRFQAVWYSWTRPNQAGFRAGRGCADQVFTLRRILKFCHNYQIPTAVGFVDFAVAFDSVHRESLWRILALDGVPAKIIAMIKAYYRSTTARVRSATIFPNRLVFALVIDTVVCCRPFCSTTLLTAFSEEAYTKTTVLSLHPDTG